MLIIFVHSLRGKIDSATLVYILGKIMCKSCPNHEECPVRSQYEEKAREIEEKVQSLDCDMVYLREAQKGGGMDESE